MRPGAFLDRDGVLNIDHGYIHKAEDWEWSPGAIEAVRWLNDHGFAVVVVTNQSGIGRGMYTEGDLDTLHAYVQAELGRHGARIDRFYHCPHAPDVECDCRKPLPGMIEQGIRELGIDRAKSFLIGDRETDLQAAIAARIRGVLYQGSDLLEFVRSVAENA